MSSAWRKHQKKKKKKKNGREKIKKERFGF